MSRFCSCFIFSSAKGLLHFQHIDWLFCWHWRCTRSEADTPNGLLQKGHWRRKSDHVWWKTSTAICKGLHVYFKTGLRHLRHIFQAYIYDVNTRVWTERTDIPVPSEFHDCRGDEVLNSRISNRILFAVEAVKDLPCDLVEFDKTGETFVTLMTGLRECGRGLAIMYNF